MIRRFVAYALACLLLGCTAQAPHSPRSRTVRIAAESEPGFLDPKRARTQCEFATLHLLYEGLININGKNQSTLGLANVCEISDDGKIYTFQLRDSYWSNGDPVTAHHFISAWQTALSPDFPAVNAAALFVIKNAKKICNGKLPPSTLGVYAPNPHMLVIELEESIPHILDILSQTVFLPMHPSGEVNISNGPFYLDKWEHHDRMVMVKNPYYHESDNVQIDAIEVLVVSDETALHMYEAGETDWVGIPYSNIPVETIPSLSQRGLLQRAESLATTWVQMNVEKVPFHNLHIRRAFAHAINRQEIVDHVLLEASSPTDSIVPKSLLDTHHPELLTPKLPDQGVANLIQTGPQITLTYRSTPDWHKVAQVLQQQWKEAFGITVKLEAVEAQVFFSRIIARDYQMALIAWRADFADPMSFLGIFDTKASGSGDTNWSNAKYSSLIAQSQSTRDRKQRLKLLCAAEQILIDEMPVMPLYERPLLYLKSPRLQNLDISATAMLDFEHAFLN